jgi:hypothetical protein
MECLRALPLPDRLPAPSQRNASARRSLRRLPRVVQGGDLPPAELFREHQRETRTVSSCERPPRGVQQGVDVHESDVRAEQAHALNGQAICALGVDGPEDRCMASGDRGPPAEVLAADGDEVGVNGEGAANASPSMALQAASSWLTRPSIAARSPGARSVGKIPLYETHLLRLRRPAVPALPTGPLAPAVRQPWCLVRAQQLAARPVHQPS